jgi:hypothetical protein
MNTKVSMGRRRGGGGGLLLWAFFCALCSIGLLTAHGNEDAGETLSAAKLQELVMDSHNAWLVLYSQGPKDNMASDLEQIQAKVGTYNVRLGTVDCSAKEHKKSCQALGPQVPSLQFYTEGPALNPYTKKNYRKSVPYAAGSLDLPGLERFISKNFPNKVEKVSELSHLTKSLEAKKDRAAVLLFSDKEVVSMFYKSIALELSRKFEFFQVLKSARDVFEKYSVESAPALVVIDGDKTESFSPEDKADYKNRDALVSWLNSIEVSTPAVSDADAKEQTTGDDSHDQQQQGNTNASQRVKQLDGTFAIDSIPGDESWVVLVHNHDDVASGAADWDKTSKWCEGKIRPAELACHKVDTSSASLLTKSLCSDFSTATAESTTSHFHFVVPYGSSTSSRKKLIPTSSMDVAAYNSKLTAFKFSANQADQAKRSAGDSLPDHVVRYVEGDAGLQNFLADAAGQQLIGAIVVSDKDTPPTFLRNMALTVGQIAKVGFMRGLQPGLAKMIGNPTLPTMVCFFAAPESSNTPKGQLQVGVYDANAFGPMRLASLTTFTGWVYQQSAYKETNPIEDEATRKQREMGTISGKVQNSVVNVVSNKDWEAQCGPNFKGICALALTGREGETDAKVMASTLQLIGSAGAAFKFLNVDGHCYQSFASAFEVDQGQLPTFVAFSPSKLRFATFRGAYTAVCILVIVLCVHDFDTAFRSQASGREFFDSILTGGSKTTPMSQRPTVPSECEFSNDDTRAEVADDSGEGKRFAAPTCYDNSIHRILVQMQVISWKRSAEKKLSEPPN